MADAKPSMEVVEPSTKPSVPKKIAERASDKKTPKPKDTDTHTWVKSHRGSSWLRVAKPKEK